MKIHPEVREQFHDLLRWHFQYYRKGREPEQVRKDMRSAAVKEQAALLKATCEIKIAVEHAFDCNSQLYFMMRCDCTPKQMISFVDPSPDYGGITFLPPAIIQRKGYRGGRIGE